MSCERRSGRNLPLISISIGSITKLRYKCVYINNVSLHNYIMPICIDKAAINVKDADLSG